MFLSLRCSSWQRTWVTHLPWEAALVWSAQPPWAGISLVIEATWGSCVLKKKKAPSRSQSPLLAPPWGMDNSLTFLKLLWTSNKPLLEMWKSVVKKIPRIMDAVANEMWIYVTTHSWCIFYAWVLPCDESTASRGHSFNDMIHIFLRTLYTAQTYGNWSLKCANEMNLSSYLKSYSGKVKTKPKAFLKAWECSCFHANALW